MNGNKFFWKTSAIVALVFSFLSDVKAQDSTRVAKASAKDFGLFFGVSRVQLDVASTDYFSAATQQLVSVGGASKSSLSIGLFYNFPIKPKWMTRLAVEAHLANIELTYHISNGKTESYSVYPVVIETPLTLVYGINQRGAIESSRWRGWGILAGIRPVIPLTVFNSSYPQTQSATWNVDLGLTIPKALRKSIMRTELFVSANVVNMMAKGKADDFRTNMITDMRRHFVGMRLYFN
jgi:hypothetical protein